MAAANKPGAAKIKQASKSREIEPNLTIGYILIKRQSKVL
jgi:hypothetical protein